MANPTTDRGPARKPRKRASKRLLRLLAWGAGAMSFATPWVALNLVPRPRAATPQKPQVIVVHRVIKRVVWQQAPAASQPKVRYVYVAGGAGGSTAAPAATTSGSHP